MGTVRRAVARLAAGYAAAGLCVLYELAAFPFEDEDLPEQVWVLVGCRS